jgi:hypothetical protein
MNLSIGEAVHYPGNRTSRSFAVAGARRAPLLTLTYQTAGEAGSARSVVAPLLAQAIEIFAHPVRSYSIGS